MSVLVMCAATAFAKDKGSDEQMRLLRLENKQLKLEMTMLKKKIKSDTTKASAGATKTFSIHEKNPQWWANPAAFTFEFTLREMIRSKYPKEAVMSWLARHRFFNGQKVSWTMRIDSIKPVAEEEAGEKYYAGLGQIRKQEAEMRKLKAQPIHRDYNRKAAQRKQFILALVKLKRMQIENKSWKKLLDSKGGVILKASFQEIVKTEGRVATSSRQVKYFGKKIILTLAVPGQSATELDNYIESKEQKHPTGSDDWPILISGKMNSLKYDATSKGTISVIVDGTWKEAEGGGTSQTSHRRTRSRKRSRPKPKRKRSRHDEMEMMRPR